MAYKSFVAGTTALASDMNTYLMNQSVMVFTNSTARDAALSAVVTEGMVAYLTASDHYTIYNGSAWVIFDIAWNAYTPTTTAITFGTGSSTACYYARIGKTVIVSGRITLGTSPTVSGNITVSLPVDIYSAGSTDSIGTVIMRDSLAAVSYFGYANASGSAPSTMGLFAQNSAATYASGTRQSATIPFTWSSAANHYIQFNVMYRGV